MDKSYGLSIEYFQLISILFVTKPMWPDKWHIIRLNCQSKYTI